MTFSPDGRDDAWWAEQIRRHRLRLKHAAKRMQRDEIAWIEDCRGPIHRVIEHPLRIAEDGRDPGDDGGT